MKRRRKRDSLRHQLIAALRARCDVLEDLSPAEEQEYIASGQLRVGDPYPWTPGFIYHPEEEKRGDIILNGRLLAKP